MFWDGIPTIRHSLPDYCQIILIIGNFTEERYSFVSTNGYEISSIIAVIPICPTCARHTVFAFKFIIRIHVADDNPINTGIDW